MQSDGRRISFNDGIWPEELAQEVEQVPCMCEVLDRSLGSVSPKLAEMNAGFANRSSEFSSQNCMNPWNDPAELLV